ncbi:7881_t:CDS:1, partial [Gigaspora rosea]
MDNVSYLVLKNLYIAKNRDSGNYEKQQKQNTLLGFRCFIKTIVSSSCGILPIS